MSVRAAIVVTGTEVLTGRVSDRNGPWLAEQLRAVGSDIAQIVVVGDRPDDLRHVLHTLSTEDLDLIITSGGLGPTADDLTAEVVGQVQQRPLVLDDGLRLRIADIVAALETSRSWIVDPAFLAHGVAKQAMVPSGATVIEPVGTAAGFIVPAPPGRTGPPVVVLPGPPNELQGMWPAVIKDPTVLEALAGRAEVRQQTLRLWGTSESEIAATLRQLDGQLDGLEITTCLRTGELEVVTRYNPAAEPAYQLLADAVQNAYPTSVFSTDGRTIDEIVAALLLEQNLTVATAESCTAGMVSARLTDLAGSSAYVLGGLVVYSNEAKTALAGVPADLIAQVGAVSEEVALALADGARTRLGAGVGIGITGIAGPGGATPGKPVGLVHLAATTTDRRISRRIVALGSRANVRSRATAVAMHLIREIAG